MHPDLQLPGRLGLTPDNKHYTLPDLKGKRVLEIGCNVGLLARHIVNNCEPAEYLGVDVETVPNQTPELASRFELGDVESIETLPYGYKPDVVICIDVYYHLPNPLMAFKNLESLAGEMLVIGGAIIPEGRRYAGCPNVADHVAHGPLARFEPGYKGDWSNFWFFTDDCMRRVLMHYCNFKSVDLKNVFKETEVLGGMVDRHLYWAYK